jgi:hypothetical protein
LPLALFENIIKGKIESLKMLKRSDSAEMVGLEMLRLMKPYFSMRSVAFNEISVSNPEKLPMSESFIRPEYPLSEVTAKIIKQ